MTDGEPRLTRDDTLRALAALEAAWREDEQALAALAGGPDERPLPVLLATYGHRTMQALLALACGGSIELTSEETDALLDRMSRNTVVQLSGVLDDVLAAWAGCAGHDAAAAGHIGRTVIAAVAAVSRTDSGDEVLPLLAALRAQTLQDEEDDEA
jgi:hypothetical protein